MSDGAQKIASVIKPLLDEMAKTIKADNVAQTQELLINMQTVMSRLDVLEKMVAKEKKAPKTEKKAVEAPAETATVQPAAKTFPTNKFVYFKTKFRDDVAFRQKYVTKEMQALIDKDEKINSKTKEEQRIIETASWCWKHIKDNVPALLTMVETEYDEAKKAHNSGNNPVQQTADPTTPE